MFQQPKLNKLYQYHSKELKFRIFYLVFTWILAFSTAFFNMEFLLYKLSLPTFNKAVSSEIPKSILPSTDLQSFISLPTGSELPLHLSSSLSDYVSASINSSTQPFIFTEVFEAFFSYLLVSGYLAFLLTLPLFYYHIYKFLLPGLSLSEATLFKSLFFISLILFSIAHCLTYFTLIPYATSFFLAFQSGQPLGISLVEHSSFTFDSNTATDAFIPSISFLGRIYPWITFLLNLFTLVSFLFQLPLILFTVFILFNKAYISRGSILNTHIFEKTASKESQHKRNTTFLRKLLFFSLLLLTAVFSPPDIYSQLFLFIPLFVIVEVFILAVLIYLEYLKTHRVN